ncbi:hypothetical protein LJ737_06255 [Hymenobacter sp. 15J16-1T3B]|uniref:hypothetical protein n=1 Tax=Hymenobacter sp. 15J16-1T3B TaxID=2886941 RepID=UPI001D116521|nr:hypothetical protein [Hymenobacter sp. 15J16-1T3B]MCC3156829.1 hypothetical protein [Hymenobacter sp. 15J16-1T3B]
MLLFLLVPGRWAGAQSVPAWLGAGSVGSASRSSCLVDAAGNTYVSGTFYAPAVIGTSSYTPVGGNDGYLVKYTLAGAVEWLFRLSSAGSETLRGLAQDAAGNLYVCGSTTGSVTLGNGLVASGEFLLRLSPQGTPQWVQPLGASGYQVGTDAAGHVFVVGMYRNTLTLAGTTLNIPAGNNLSSAPYLARFDAATGAPQRLTAAGYYPSFTGQASLFTSGLAVSPAGDAYVLTVFGERLVVGTDTLVSRGSNDGLIVKFNAQGTREWMQQLGGSLTDHLYQAATDAAGNLYAAGAFMQAGTVGGTAISSAGGYDGFLAKFSPDGALQWVRTGGGPSLDMWYGLSVDAAGNAYLAGTFFGTASHGGGSVSSAGDSDAVVAAYSPQGQLGWVQRAGGSAADDAFYAGVDAQGRAHVYGSLRGPATFGPATVTPTLLSSTVFSENYLAHLGSAALAARPSAAHQPLLLYPNPAHEAVRLVGLPAGTPVQFIDARGRVAREAQAGGEVSVRGLPAGLYTLRARDAHGRSYSGRVAVE